MAPPNMFPTDEELGKRDDDYAPGTKSTQSWRNLPYNYRRRRIAIIIGAVLFVWLVLHVISNGGDPGYTVYDAARPPKAGRPDGPPPKAIDDIDEAARQHYYNGHVKFFELGESLHQISNAGGLRDKNRNVLFAASNLKSVSALIPLACEMGKWNRNHVHFTIMGRYDVELDDILEVNGVDRQVCEVHWHDARPDYVTYSSDYRAEAVVVAALGHIHTFMHPQAIITDDSAREDTFFTRGVRRKTGIHNLPVIEIPQNRADNLEWLTRLDSSSLRAWHAPSVDILIHAPPKASGSLIRLLQSIQDADYSGLTPPRITVELPPDVDPPSMWFLEHMAWPPAPKNPFLTPRHNGLILHHRIPDQKISSDEAAVRFLESFYPSLGSHVLLLAPNAQLSPLYYHYLLFHLLEYRYSTYASLDNDRLLGLSLELPTHHLNGTTAFEPPKASSSASDAMDRAAEDIVDKKYAFPKARQADVAVPFTWQAPNSNAALYFGDKWPELHSFLQHRLRAFRLQANPTPRPRTVHESLPTWLEYFLELMRARGYALLYPGIEEREQHSLVTVHNELYQPPEEMLREASKDDDEDNKEEAKEEEPSPFLTANPAAALAPPLHAEPAATLSNALPLHEILPFDSGPPALARLPALSHQGLVFADEREAKEKAGATAAKFRVAIGGCEAEQRLLKGMRRRVVSGSARDLFCFGDEGPEGWESDDGKKEKEDGDDEVEEKVGPGKAEVDKAEGVKGKSADNNGEKDDYVKTGKVGGGESGGTAADAEKKGL